MIDVINFKQMKFSKIFFLSVVSFSAFLGINSSYAGTCVETSPGVNRCYSSSGGSSVTIETSPGVLGITVQMQMVILHLIPIFNGDFYTSLEYASW